MKLTAVLLDIDGTLVESNEAHARAWSEAATEHGFQRPIEFFRPLIGMGGDRIFPTISAELNEQTPLGKAISSRRKELMLTSYLPTCKATLGAHALVERLKAKGLRRIIASSTTSEELDAVLAIAGIESLIDDVVTSADVAHAKPAPDVIAVALRKAKTSSDNVVLIGDSPYDIESGSHVGVATVALRCGGFHDEVLTGAVAIYDHPLALLERFSEVFS